MWITFDSIEYNPKCTSRNGKTFAGWVAKGTKKGFDDEPDSPWEKVFFDNNATTIIERGISRPGCSIVEFLQKACKKGDTLVIRNERDGKFWRVVSMQNISMDKPSYTPLTEAEVATMQASQATEVAHDALKQSAQATPEEGSESMPWLK
jgi:hypothetical protein